jgi:hypothetical protein
MAPLPRLAVLLACLSLPGVAAAAELAAHHATYKLTLGSTHGENVTAATGSMTYDVTDACEAWTVQQRLDMTLTNQQGQDIRMLSDYATWESKDGLKIRFHMRQTTDAAVTEQVDGEASLDRTGGPGQVRYTTPADTTKALPPGTLFPMSHTGAILDAAGAGHRFISVPLFDGTGDEGAQDTFITITSWGPPGAAKLVPPPPEALALLPSGTVHVAFFDRGGSANSPDYEVSMRYWANGVADHLAMDFGDFVMDGTLADFHLTPGHC